MSNLRAWAACAFALWMFPAAAADPDSAKSGTAAKQDNVNHALSGDYAFASAEHCAYASRFGPPPLLEPIGEVSLEHAVVDGVLTLDGKGSGTLRARLGSSGTAPWFGRPLLSLLSCDVSYRAASDGSFEFERKCEGTRAIGNGSQTASQWTASPAVFIGHVNGDVLSFTDTRQAVERYVIFGGTAMRVCNRIGTATKIKPLK